MNYRAAEARSMLDDDAEPDFSPTSQPNNRTASAPVRVVICDDHRLFVDALAVVLEARGCKVVARTLHPDGAVAAVAANEVDVCVMDLSFPDADGLEGTRAVVAASPATQVVMLTGSADAMLTAPGVEAGVRGFARKDDELDNIVGTIKRVHAGEIITWSTPPTPGSDYRTTREANAGQHLARFLTAREREVLERLVRGESTSTLAKAMDVSYHTARTHIQNVLAKLGVHSKLEAVAFAVGHSVVAVTPDTEGTTRKARRTSLRPQY